MAQIRKYKTAGSIEGPANTQSVENTNSAQTPETAPTYGKIVFDGKEYNVNDSFLSAIENFSPQGKAWAEDLKQGKNRYIYQTESGFSFSDASDIGRQFGKLNDRQERKLGQSGRGGWKVRQEKENWHNLGTFIKKHLETVDETPDAPKDKIVIGRSVIPYFFAEDGKTIQLPETSKKKIQSHIDKLIKAFNSDSKDGYEFWDKITLDDLKQYGNVATLTALKTSLLDGTLTQTEIADAKTFGIDLETEGSTSVENGVVYNQTIVVGNEEKDKLEKEKNDKDLGAYAPFVVAGNNYFFGDSFRKYLKTIDPEKYTDEYIAKNFGNDVFVINGKMYKDWETLQGNETFRKFISLNKERKYDESNREIYWDWNDLLKSMEKITSAHITHRKNSSWIQNMNDLFGSNDPDKPYIYLLYPGSSDTSGNDKYGFNLNPIWTVSDKKGNSRDANHSDIGQLDEEARKTAKKFGTIRRKSFSINGNTRYHKKAISYGSGNAKKIISINEGDDGRLYITHYQGDSVFKDIEITDESIYNELYSKLNTLRYNTVLDYIKKLKLGGIVKAQKGVVLQVPVARFANTDSNTQPEKDVHVKDTLGSNNNLIDPSVIDVAPVQAELGWNNADFVQVGAIAADAMGLAASLTSYAKKSPKWVRTASTISNFTGTALNSAATYMRDGEWTPTNTVSTLTNLGMDVLGTRAVNTKINSWVTNPTMKKVIAAGKLGLFGYAGFSALTVLLDKNQSGLNKLQAVVSLGHMANAVFGSKITLGSYNIRKTKTGYTIKSTKKGIRDIQISNKEYDELKNMSNEEIKRFFERKVGKTSIKTKNQFMDDLVAQYNKRAVNKIKKQGDSYVYEVESLNYNDDALNKLDTDVKKMWFRAEELFEGSNNKVTLKDFGFVNSDIKSSLPLWSSQSETFGKLDVKASAPFTYHSPDNITGSILADKTEQIFTTNGNTGGQVTVMEEDIAAHKKGGVLKCQDSQKFTPKFPEYSMFGTRYKFDPTTGKFETMPEYSMFDNYKFNYTTGKFERIPRDNNSLFGNQSPGADKSEGRIVTDPKKSFLEKIPFSNIERGLNSAGRVAVDMFGNKQAASHLKNAENWKGTAYKSIIPDVKKSINLSPILMQIEETKDDIEGQFRKSVRITDGKGMIHAGLETSKLLADAGDRGLKYLSSEMDKYNNLDIDRSFKTLLGNIEKSDYNSALGAQTGAGKSTIDAQTEMAKAQSIYKLLHERAQELALDKTERKKMEFLKAHPDLAQQLIAYNYLGKV